MDKQLEKIIRLIDSIGNNDTVKNGLSIDLPKPTQKAIKDSISYDSLVAIMQTVDPNAKMTLDKKTLIDECYKLKRSDHIGTWDDVYYFCVVNNHNNMVVYGLDESKRPIAQFDGNINVKMQVNSADMVILTAFYLPIE